MSNILSENNRSASECIRELFLSDFLLFLGDEWSDIDRFVRSITNLLGEDFGTKLLDYLIVAR